MVAHIYCLAHDGSVGGSCERREQCYRHLSLREVAFDSSADVIIGTGCVQRDYQAFLPIGIKQGD